jgi:ketosteroid isomerase-like protein
VAGDFTWAERAEDFELVTSPENPDAGAYRGAEAVRWLGSWRGSFDGLQVEVLEMTDAGDKVLAAVVQRGRPHGSGVELEQRWWQVLTLRGGLLTRLETFRERSQALEAAGLTPP